MHILIIVFFFLTVIYLFLICPNLSRKHEMKPFFQTHFAHRGYFSKQNLIPENSMAAFREAVRHGYGIELDIHLTKDHKLVVFHDDTLSRMCRKDAVIEELTYDELSELHLDHTPEKIPLFNQVLQYVNGRVPLLIEVKLPGRDPHICEHALAELQSYDGRYLIQSFNTLVLYWFRMHAPFVLRGQLSCGFFNEKKKKHILFHILVRNLMTNAWGRPDFISYKLKDIPNLGLSLNQHFFCIPIAVWTLRTKDAFEKGIQCYDMQIFEKF